MQNLKIIIDFDNTLVATNAFVGEHLEKTCKRIGVLMPDKNILMAKLKENPPFEKIFSDLFREKGEMILAAYRENAMETPYRETPGGNEFVQTLSRQGVSMVIVSNRVNKLEERLIQAGYDPKSFLSIIKAEPVKPDQRAYDSAIALLSGKQVTIIGDHPDDYLACPDNLRAGFTAILTGLTTAEEFTEAGVTKSNIWPKLDYQKLLAI